MATLTVWATDRNGEEFCYAEREVEYGTEATADFRFDLVREAEEQGFVNVWSQIIDGVLPCQVERIDMADD